MAIKKVSKVEKVLKVSKIKSSKSSGVSKKEPQTMEELLATTGYQVQGLKRSQTVSGRVTNISLKAVYIDIGAKTEGVVIERGFEAARDFIKTLKVGDQVSAQVVSPESESGQILLSLKKTASSQAWQNLQEAKEKNDEVEVKVLETTRAGLIVEIQGLTGFIPGSQLATSWQGQENQLLDRKIKVRIIEIDEANNKLIFSEKAVSEKEKIAQIGKAIQKVKVGGEYLGTVTGITPFGVFVQITARGTLLEGLVHISEVAWEKVEDLADFLKVGQEAKVKVIGVDKEAGRLALSLKQLLSDPWQERIKKYPVETKISGKVTKLTSFGAFLEIEPGLEGLLHISKIPPEQKINVGDQINCFVESIESEKRRLSLGLVLSKKPVGYK